MRGRRECRWGVHGRTEGPEWLWEGLWSLLTMCTSEHFTHPLHARHRAGRKEAEDSPQPGGEIGHLPGKPIQGDGNQHKGTQSCKGTEASKPDSIPTPCSSRMGSPLRLDSPVTCPWHSLNQNSGLGTSGHRFFQASLFREIHADHRQHIHPELMPPSSVIFLLLCWPLCQCFPACLSSQTTAQEARNCVL